jgi:predicted transcriptional regulator of viral defense system
MVLSSQTYIGLSQGTKKMTLSKDEHRKSLSERESRILSDLSFRGKAIFVPADLEPYEIDVKRFLLRLRRKGWIAWIKRGLYVIAPLEAGAEGAMKHTVHGFVLASHMVSPSYVGFWSALNYHGMSEATPPAVYVAARAPVASRTIFDIPFVFVTLRPWKMFGTERVLIEREGVAVSDPEKTVVDCLDHPEHAGGVLHLADVLREEFDRLDFDRLLRYAKRMRNTTILKRLGYLLEAQSKGDEARRVGRHRLGEGYSKLDPKLPARGPTNERWKLRVNVNVDREV